MTRLAEDISTFVSYHTEGFIQRIRDLEKQLTEKEIVIEHYKNVSNRAQKEVTDAKAELLRVKVRHVLISLPWQSSDHDPRPRNDASSAS